MSDEGSKTPIQRRLRRWLQKSALVLASVVVSFALAEGFMRLLGYQGVTYLRIENTTLVEDPALNWRHTPNNVYHFNNVEYRINQNGFRDHAYPEPKPPGTFRVFLTSDSIGYGVNIQMEDSYPKALEVLLNELPDARRFEVINYSMPGLSLSQKLHLVELHAQSYDPDVIIIDYCMNDMAPDIVWREPERQTDCTIGPVDIPIPCAFEDVLKKSAFVFALRQLTENMLLKSGRELDNRNYRNVQGDHFQRMYGGEAHARLDEAFGGMRAYQDQHGVPVFVPIFPILYEMATYRWSDLAGMVETACERHGLSYLHLLDTFDDFADSEIRVQRGDFFHPSIEGHRAAAEAVMASMILEGLLDVESADAGGR